MCFLHEYDWYASVSEESQGPLNVPTRCTECGRRLNSGEWALQIHQQEKECCDDCECDSSPDCHCETCPDGCDLGEVVDYTACEKCELIRKAIRDVEEAEGCIGDEAEPPRGMMVEGVNEGEGWDHYLDQFLSMGFIEAYEAARVFRDWRTADDIMSRLKDEYPNAYCYYQDDLCQYEVGGEA
jgi:hypothetical protein